MFCNGFRALGDLSVIPTKVGIQLVASFCLFTSAIIFSSIEGAQKEGKP